MGKATVRDIIVNLPTADVDATKSFYADLLGLDVEEFSLGWVTRMTSAETGAHVQLVTRDETAPADSIATLRVDDVDAAYAEAVQRGDDIVHPLTTEAWGVQRFFVRDPSGNVLNIAQHH